MTATLTVEEAQARLKEVISKLAPGEEVVITDNQQPVAKLVGQRPATSPRPWRGRGIHSLHGPRFRRADGRVPGVHSVKLLLDSHAFLWLVVGY